MAAPAGLDGPGGATWVRGGGCVRGVRGGVARMVRTMPVGAAVGGPVRTAIGSPVPTAIGSPVRTAVGGLLGRPHVPVRKTLAVGVTAALGVDADSTALVVIGVEVRVEFIGPAQFLLDLGPGRARALPAQPSGVGEALRLRQLFLCGRTELSRTGTDLLGFGILPRRATTDLDGPVAGLLRLDPALFGPTLCLFAHRQDDGHDDQRDHDHNGKDENDGAALHLDLRVSGPRERSCLRLV